MLTAGEMDDSLAFADEAAKPSEATARVNAINFFMCSPST
jgi:hypothetical protein